MIPYNNICCLILIFIQRNSTNLVRLVENYHCTNTYQYFGICQGLCNVEKKSTKFNRLMDSFAGNFFFSKYLNSFIIKCILMIFCTNTIDGNIYLITNQHSSSHDICILNNMMLVVSDY